MSATAVSKRAQNLTDDAAREVADWPRLSEEQRAQLAALLRPTGCGV